VLHGSEWQDPTNEVDNSKRKGKKDAIADDKEILQEGAELHFSLLGWVCAQSQPFKVGIKP
jgi:hypothetical protein